MKIFSKVGNRQLTKIQKRISNLTTHELTMWAENALYVIGKNVAGVGPKTPEKYDEALEGAQILAEICQELKKRNT
jgi:hypothetical protein